jgi:hypothetical protein
MPHGAVRQVHLWRRIKFAAERLRASARAGSWFGRWRRSVRFAARGVEQDGVLLLMPREPSLAFYYVPLAILFTAGGAALAAFG